MELADLSFSHSLEDGTDVRIRPIRPDDAAIEQEFVRSLSPQSKFRRFFTPLKELSPAALEYFTHTHYPDNVALIATIEEQGIEREIGVARYMPTTEPGKVEFAVVVADQWQGKGIATRLLRHLFDIASEAGIRSIEGLILRENRQMLKLARELGFSVRSTGKDPGVIHVHRAS